MRVLIFVERQAKARSGVDGHGVAVLRRALWGLANTPARDSRKISCLGLGDGLERRGVDGLVKARRGNAPRGYNHGASAPQLSQFGLGMPLKGWPRHSSVGRGSGVARTGKANTRGEIPEDFWRDAASHVAARRSGASPGEAGQG